ncbi:malto-oligosyltrehalose synthase [Rhodococcus spelaei]|uniref:Malto-oligosyltrehalose synthase n=1 Tax=Rhodococcus spelaei TaxID=2546320 RepID=A0A541BMW0_9NOCA|nr:malto-oligosyltrehalose synthase [Rhodococcus spelaei]TQF73649.1 malto-oligosyltrehalose synthase [Rhodococcus spelaei]
MQPITGTYRLQLRADALTLNDACEIADYLDDLGVSHLYLSPVLTAAEGSVHGYDVTDPTTLAPGLGGRKALVSLVTELRRRGMGIVVDLVPNHVGVADAWQNRWWWDVLTHGRDSEYARYFDIDWERGRFALPVLGDDGLAAVTIDDDGPEPRLAYHEHRFPIAPGTEAFDPRRVHGRQPYELVHWRSGRVGYRRFFTVNSLAALRQEDPTVFAATHREPASWFAEDLVDGVRVDHPDGLADPADYLARLRGLLGPDRWLVIEKVLAPGEPLDPALPVDGTTGYDALAEYGGVFVDPSGAEELGRLHAEGTGDSGDARALARSEHELKGAVLRGALAPEVRRLVGAVRRESAAAMRGEGAAALSDEALTRAVVATVTEVPVYRTDYGPLAGTLGAAVARAAESDPTLAEPLSAVVAAVLTGGEAAVRLQQVCGAAMAKAVEDRLFYRTARLVSLQEVGGDPGSFALPVAQFHLAQAERARRWPAAMTTLSTHDTKRGEDVRARIGVLSQVPATWSASVGEWESTTPSPDRATGLFLWQNMFGVWPTHGSPDADVRRRLHDYATKAIREAGVHTSWERVDADFEARVHEWLDAVFDGPVAASMSTLVDRLAPHGRIVALGQKLLQLTGPGIPDVYQGTELWEDSLVDPDNRRIVDFDRRRRLLAELGPGATGEAAKLLVTREALRLRRERPDCFVGGSYRPILAGDSASGHLLGFARGGEVIALATRLSVQLTAAGGWTDTTVTLPAGTWTDTLTGTSHTGEVRVGTMLDALPVALLVRA